MKADFDRLAPEERRIILVASAQKYAEIVSQLDKEKLVGLLPVLLAGGLGVVSASAASLFVLQALGSAYRGLLRSPSGDDGPKDLRNLAKRALTKGEIVLPHLSPLEAARRFRFDIGDPEDGAA